MVPHANMPEPSESELRCAQLVIDVHPDPPHVPKVPEAAENLTR